ncbi:hypothetical protein [Sphingobium sp. LSP13-1-1.1]|uniref:hypothetical protein n=1 Tax=Sphingobium sp. LSP13-1-1.1 TaxID=3135234 RepID=UPI003412A3F5
MGKLVDYEVARQHLGDLITDDGVEGHMFMPGDTRTADPAVVKHLVGTVLIDPASSKSEEDAAPENKAEGNAPKNKSKTKGE